MSLTSIVDQLKSLSADKRVHFVIQSLNGFKMDKQLLKEDSLEVCNIFEKDLVVMINLKPLEFSNTLWI